MACSGDAALYLWTAETGTSPQQRRHGGFRAKHKASLSQNGLPPVIAESNREARLIPSMTTPDKACPLMNRACLLYAGNVEQSKRVSASLNRNIMRTI